MKRSHWLYLTLAVGMTLCLAGAALIAYAQREGLVNHVNFNRATWDEHGPGRALFGEPGQDAMREGYGNQWVIYDDDDEIVKMVAMKEPRGVVASRFWRKGRAHALNSTGIIRHAVDINKCTGRKISPDWDATPFTEKNAMANTGSFASSSP